MSFVDYLAQKQLLDAAQAERVKEDIRTGKSVDALLAAYGIDDTVALAARGEYLNVPTRSLKDVNIPYEIAQYIPEESALHYKVVPIGVSDGTLEVGMVDPNNFEARDALNFISARVEMPFKVFLVTEDDFKQAVNAYKGLSGTVTQALGEYENQAKEEEEELSKIGVDKPGKAAVAGGEAMIIEDAPVKRIVATVLRYAVEGGASDIHIEPLRDRTRVRYRVDGLMNTSLVLPQKVHNALVARIKVLSEMKLDEKRKPQDGRFSVKLDGRKIDLRVSTFPAYYGEKVVMRILDQDKGVRKLDQFGISDYNMSMIRKAIEAPYGLVLISGPTGSGKTTTLYSILNEVDKEGYNVLSLEDPVEYSIDGVSQSQVHAEIGYTFASGLRTTLRQDPDIILVGEIRDGETAKLAIQAALTGHLVFSTIHTNSAAGIVPRLIDMGVDPYLIAPTLVCGMAQRLVRTLCPGAGKSLPVDGSVKQMIDAQFTDLPDEFKTRIPNATEVYMAAPTEECPTGTRGRTAVLEVFEMSRDMEQVILKNPTENAVYDVARKQGMLTMKEDALIKALRKEIPFEEVNKL
jgi:type IV pilus assembly protein PilB